ncbi:MAG: iron chelate uptake ABC transporter family permease subunit [Actinomycetota bacterium]
MTAVGVTALRAGPVSLRIDRRALATALILVSLIATLALWSISVGEFPVPLADVISHLRGDPSPDSEYIIGRLRLPRVLTGVLVGASFGLSGAVVQSLTRNPLGSPDVLGLDAGAAVGAVFVIVFLNGSGAAVAGGAVVGGMATAVLIYLAGGRGRVAATRLVLVGIGVGAVARAGVELMLTRAASFEIQRAMVWLTGSLNGRSWVHVRSVALAMIVLVPLIMLGQRRLATLEFGDDVAAGLGVPLGRTRSSLLLAAVALTAVAVAAAGPIGFVALIAPPIARRLVRGATVALATSALVGALLVVAADLAARRAFAPTELPVGLMTAAIGAPYLLWLIQRRLGGRP